MAELLKVREITVDTMQYKDFATKEEELKVMRFYQNDLNSAKLLINVTHDKVVTDFSTATKVQIAFLKPDGKRVFQDVQNVNQMQGKYYVVLSTQTLIAYGNVVAQLRLTFPNNKVIETCKFVFAVDESIMSDTALESTNEFPVIQKAIEAGKKLEGVDIDGIIAAGAKADAALPKAGGTMTGPISFNNTSAKNGVQFQSGGASKSILSGDATRINLWDNVAAADVWSYNHTTKQFDITAATNVVKKAGDTMTGTLTLNSELRFEGATSVQQMLFKGDGTTTKSVWLAKSQEGIVVIPETTPGSGSRDWANAVYLGGNQNGVVKKAGDAVTGQLVISGVSASMKIDDKAGSIQVHQPTEVTTSARGLTYHEGGVLVGGIGRIRNGAGLDQMYIGWGANPWSENTSLTVSDTKFLYKNKPVAMRDKDGMVSLTLTSDATNANAGYLPIADRKGNTVTVRMEVTRNVGSASSLICTLPADVRPVNTVSMNFLANDGSVVGVNITWDGKVEMYTTGKQTKIVATFVAN